MKSIRIVWSVSCAVSVLLAIGAKADFYPCFPVDEFEEMRHMGCHAVDVIKPTEVQKPDVDRYGFAIGEYELEYRKDIIKWHSLIYAPSNHPDNAVLPLIVHIPGIGEIGPDISRQFRQRALFDLITSEKFQKRHPCCFVSLSPPDDPGSFFGQVGRLPCAVQRQAEAVVRFAIQIIAVRWKIEVDTNRIYTTGFSFGGEAAYMLAVGYPEIFAASVPIASVAPIPELIDKTRPGNFWHICNEGDWAGHGAALEAVKELRDCVNRLGGDFRISLYPGKDGHDAWTTAWQEEAVWDWMFSKTLAPKKKSGATGSSGRADEASTCSFADAVCSATVDPIDESFDATRPIDFLDETYYEPSTPFGPSDAWQIRLADPIAGRVRIETGDPSGAKILKSGIVETSTNGRIWRRAGAFAKDTGVAEFKTVTPFKFLRVRTGRTEKTLFVIRKLTIYLK